jgi:hypothetical protein
MGRQPSPHILKTDLTHGPGKRGFMVIIEEIDTNGLGDSERSESGDGIDKQASNRIDRVLARKNRNGRPCWRAWRGAACSSLAGLRLVAEGVASNAPPGGKSRDLSAGR